MIPADLDPTLLLQMLGLGHWAAGVVACVMFAIAVIAHVMPYVPQPHPDAPAWLHSLWRILNAISGNYRNARPVEPPAVPPAPPPVPPTPVA